jgi:hypothetical protein
LNRAKYKKQKNFYQEFKQIMQKNVYRITNKKSIAMIRRIWTSRYVFMMLGICSVSILSCEKDKKDAPELPPESAFVINFSDFQDNQKSTQTYANWTTAAITVGVWNTVLAVTLAVPVASYIEAFNHKPVRVDNNTWKWSYSVLVNSVNYTADLYADVLDTKVNWEMYISQEGGFSNFLWYKGTCDILRTHGTWTLYHGPASNKEFLEIEWNHDWEINTGDIRYTNILSPSEGNGDYIFAGLTNDTPYNTFYDIYDNSEDNLVKINYNTETKEGSIYYDSSWHCWNSSLQDIECPE